jgi:hypothetical protein
MAVNKVYTIGTMFVDDNTSSKISLLCEVVEVQYISDGEIVYVCSAYINRYVNSYLNYGVQCKSVECNVQVSSDLSLNLDGENIQLTEIS